MYCSFSYFALYLKLSYFTMLPGDSGSSSSLASSSSATHLSPSRHTIEQLALNMGFGGIKTNLISSSSSSSLLNSTSSHLQQKLESIQDVSTPVEDSQKRLITKIDPIEMTAKPTVIVVPQDTAKRSAMLLAGPKFRLNSKEVQKTKLTINSKTIYTISVSSTIINFDCLYLK
jgi:hypothetical protein